MLNGKITVPVKQKYSLFSHSLHMHGIVNSYSCSSGNSSISIRPHSFKTNAVTITAKFNKTTIPSFQRTHSQATVLQLNVASRDFSAHRATGSQLTKPPSPELKTSSATHTDLHN